ncbi:flagellar hook-basal body complex protein FliE [Desulfomarina sp.]
MNTINNTRLSPVMPEGASSSTGSSIQQAENSFGTILSNLVTSVDESQKAGDIAVEQLQSGDASHLHEVMIAVEEADISLRMLVQMRNKALSAYEEIMRMQL